MDQENIKQAGSSVFAKNKKIIIIVIVVLALGFVVNSFFSKNAGEKMAENILEKQFGGDVKIDSDNGSVSVKNENGNFSAGEAAQWPSDMPSDVPKFTAGKITMAASVSTGDKGWQVGVSEVSKEDFTAYNSLLISNGWKNIGVFDANVGMAQMTKGNSSLLVIFNAEDGSLSLTVSVK